MRLPERLHLFTESNQVPTWLVTAPSSDPKRQGTLATQGVKVIALEPDTTAGIDLAALLRRLGDEGLTRLLVEGGGTLAAALLRAGLVDRLVWMRAPLLIGGDGIPAVAGLELTELAGAPRFALAASETAGPDVIETYRLAD